MQLTFDNRVALVTGAGRGIGRAISEELARQGVKVICVSKSESSCGAVAESINAAGGDATARPVDVSDGEAVAQAAKELLKQFGQIDILINNAGWTANGLFLEKPVEDFEREIAINLWGPINCVRAVAPAMIAREYGKIITIGSDAGRVGEYQEAVYSACKGGIIAWSKALAREFGKHNLNVNVVCPGLTLPESDDDAGANSLWHSESHQSQIFKNEEVLAKVVRRYPLRRHGVPSDIVPLVLLLASDKSSYTTGQVISVSGGYAM